mmetsp:Transcript_1454/g.2311  ORF Transcript_1454/g.2311 Transcript_1454/m.2311 type:complete len:367 (-) Transcript_1454:102-1202(-)
MGAGAWLTVVVPVLALVGVNHVAKDPIVGNLAPQGDAMMNAVVSTAPGKIEFKQVPVPKPGPGQVLVKMGYAPINPSDTYHSMGNYADQTDVPHLNGFEGMGTVVASGGGLLPFVYTKLGARLAVVTEGGGSWAEYALASPTQALPLSPSLPDKSGAAAFVNPMTVMAMVQIYENNGHKAMVHTAASSALGLQLLRVAPLHNVTVICVVRGAKNEKMLLELGHPKDLVVRSDAESFPASLKKVVDRTGATLSFDAVSGEMSQQVYEAMPAKSENYVYGMLSGERPSEELLSIGPDAEKSYSFLLLPKYLENCGVVNVVRLVYSVWSHLSNELRTDYAREQQFDEKILDTVYEFAKAQSGGKTVIKF